MHRKRALMLVESMGSLAWFAMDACWMLGFGTACLVLAVPTVLLNVLAVPFTPRRTADLLVAGSMGSWACMNAFWMTHDLRFFAGEASLLAAKVFLVLGVTMLVGSLGTDRGATRAILGSFRRLRL